MIQTPFASAIRWLLLIALISVASLEVACSRSSSQRASVQPKAPSGSVAVEPEDEPEDEPESEPTDESTAPEDGEKDPDVVYIPTPQDVVDKMLALAKVTKNDIVYDLGCGDGRVLVTAAKRYGCRAVGYDIDPERVADTQANIRANRVGALARVERKDIFTLDLSPASVVFLYLLPELNVRLIPQLDKLKPGSRVITHDFDIEGIEPDQVIKTASDEDEDDHEIYVFTTPLKRVPEGQ